MHSDWILDSGASHHIISDLSNLSLHAPYEGSDDSNKLHINHTGSLAFHGCDMLRFSDVLLVPMMAKNLLYVSRISRGNDVHVDFFDSEFQVKDSRTGGLLLLGQHVNGLYVWPAHVRTHTLPSALVSIKQSLPVWHARLGHLSTKILHAIMSAYNLAPTRSIDFSCDLCRCIKSHKLLFYKSSLTSRTPLELLFYDVWMSTVLSIDGYQILCYLC